MSKGGEPGPPSAPPAPPPPNGGPPTPRILVKFYATSGRLGAPPVFTWTDATECPSTGDTVAAPDSSVWVVIGRTWAGAAELNVSVRPNLTRRTSAPVAPRPSTARPPVAGLDVLSTRLPPVSNRHPAT